MASNDDAVITFGQFSLHRRARNLLKNGKKIVIGDRAFDLLLALVEKPGEVISKFDLLDRIWPDVAVEESNLRVHILQLRKILGPGDDGNSTIRNIAGRGYSFVQPVRRTEAPALHSILGRDEEITLIGRLLEERKLVSIVGSGGVGKTTIATTILRTAERRLDIASAFVDFSTITDPGLVPSAVAAAIGASVLLRQPIDSVVNALRGKRMLLLFDNCEHILEAAAVLAESVRAVAPNTMILVTSREPLRAHGEWVFRLGSLAAPTDADFSDPERASCYASIQLFVARAQLHHSPFVLSVQNCCAVCTLCATLDGLPLAIELAAAQVKFIGIDRLLNALQSGFDILDAPRAPDARGHRTLAAMLDWSVDALSSSERQVFLALSTFRGYFDLDAAETVACGSDASSVASPTGAFLQDFSHLIDSSLISVSTDVDPPLYRLLEVTRAYASRALASSAHYHGAHQQHALHVLKVLTSTAESDDTSDERTSNAHDNTVSRRSIDDIRSALEWSFLSEENAALACQLTIASSLVWQKLALLSEYQQRAIRALDHIKHRGMAFQEESLKLLLAVGFTDAGGANLSPSSSSDVGQAAFKSALAYAEQASAIEPQTDALYGLVVLQVKGGDYAQAYESVNRLKPLAQLSINAAALYHRLKALVDAYSGKVSTVLADLAKAKMLYEKIDDVWQRPHLGRFNQRCALSAMEARVLWEKGYPDDALAACEESAQYALKLRDQLSLCYVLATGTCPVTAWTGELDLLSEYVSIFRKVVDEQSLIYWEQWALTFEWGLKTKYDPRQAKFAERQRFSTFAPLQHEILATLDPGLLTNEAMRRADAGDAGFALPEILRSRGVLLLADGVEGRSTQAEAYFREAIDIARRNAAPSWALRAATSLLQLKIYTGNAGQAADMVNDILSTFTQGRTTLDHQLARQLLAVSQQHDADPALPRIYTPVAPI